MSNTELKEIETQEIVKELIKRNGVRKIESGVYKLYRIVRKYGKSRNTEIESNCVIIVDPDVFLDKSDNSSMQI